VIRVTKRGIKIIPAFPDYLFKKSRSRQTSRGEKRGRERRLPLPSLPASPVSARLSSPVSNGFLAGEEAGARGVFHNFSPSIFRRSRTQGHPAFINQLAFWKSRVARPPTLLQRFSPSYRRRGFKITEVI